MKNLVTLGAQHQGVFGLPGCPGESSQLCEVVRQMLSYGAYTDIVQDILVQAQVPYIRQTSVHLALPDVFVVIVSAPSSLSLPPRSHC